MVIKQVVEQATLLDTNIPRWFANKDWNYLLSNLDDPYEELVQEFYANAFFEGEELQCWVRGKDFTITPSYLALILCINRPMFPKSPVYDDMEPDLKILCDAFRENLEVSHNSDLRVEVAHNNHVSQSLPSLKHRVYESWSGYISS